jgi:hypothetical protein
MKTIYKALADFQQEVPVIHKGSTGHNYSYADLPAIFEVINPILKKNKLGFVQPLVGNKLKTIIFHTESGESIESETDLPIDSLNYKEVIVTKNGVMTNKTVLQGFEGMNKAQAIGSLITYFRRYAISSMLGLVTDKDTDASSTNNDFNL